MLQELGKLDRSGSYYRGADEQELKLTTGLKHSELHSTIDNLKRKSIIRYEPYIRRWFIHETALERG